MTPKLARRGVLSRRDPLAWSRLPGQGLEVPFREKHCSLWPSVHAGRQVSPGSASPGSPSPVPRLEPGTVQPSRVGRAPRGHVGSGHGCVCSCACGAGAVLRARPCCPGTVGWSLLHRGDSALAGGAWPGSCPAHRGPPFPGAPSCLGSGPWGSERPKAGEGLESSSPRPGLPCLLSLALFTWLLLATSGQVDSSRLIFLWLV